MENALLIYVDIYTDANEAKADYKAIKSLHNNGLVETYDAAVIIKENGGKVRVHKQDMLSLHGAWSGLAVGAVVGILFPPSILAGGVVGAVAGGLIGHFWRGMSRSDMKELGDALDDGDASLIVIGESKAEQAIKDELKRANKTYK